MSIPIKFALLWHQHQPYYKDGDTYRLPWVRLHSTKDYLEMAEHLLRNPAMHATINLVPSLLEQIEDYANGAEDTILMLSKKPTQSLTNDERREVLRMCMMINKERVISRSPRFLFLAEKKDELSEQELRDLIVHFTLGWTGEFEREKEPFASLILQDQNFTEEQKISVLDAQQKIIGLVIAAHKQLQDSGRVELTTTPFFHPILPLLCDTDSAREAMTDIPLPIKHFTSTTDAKEQLERAIHFHQYHFGQKPIGAWPAEGSISDTALDVFSETGIQWVASDEAVLQHSLLDTHNEKNLKQYGIYEKYFPRTYGKKENEIIIFFRDHTLSDKIGFDYQRWNPADAASDLIAHCKYVRDEILFRFGEDALRKACISVILDGENCWEYYPENGRAFLTELYARLTTEGEIQTLTFSEVIEGIGKENIRPINHIVAGSWINGNFKIWIGHPEKNKAWDLLSQTKETLESKKELLTDEVYHQAKNSLLKAEGSDWFWWFGDDHYSDDRLIFDELFRSYLQKVYTIIDEAIPEGLTTPIMKEAKSGAYSSMHRVS